MLSPLNCLRDGRGIGDVNRSGLLARSGEMLNGAESGRMLLRGPVDLVAFKSEDDCSVAGGVGKCGGGVLLVTLVGCLPQRDSGEWDQVRIYRCVHQDLTAGVFGDQRAENGWYFGLEFATGLDVLCAFDVGEGVVGH